MNEDRVAIPGGFLTRPIHATSLVRVIVERRLHEPAVEIPAVEVPTAAVVIPPTPAPEFKAPTAEVSIVDRETVVSAHVVMVGAPS